MMAKHQFEAGPHRVNPRAQADVAAGQRFFDQNGLAMRRRVIDDRLFGLLIQVVRDHGAIAGLQGFQPAFNGFS